MGEIKVIQTTTGSHGIHWHAIFDQDVKTESILERFVTAIETGKKLIVNDSITIITDPLMRGIINKERVVTGFPYLKGFRYQDFETRSITEWSHADNLEAVIKVGHESGCAISFFATDFAMHKDIYKNQKNLSIHIIGLAYDIIDFDVQKWNESGEVKFEENFCGYMPKSEDEIEFFGRIQSKEDYSLGEIEGFLITVGITPEFILEFFVAKKNLSIKLEVNKPVHGLAWIQGTLEK